MSKLSTPFRGGIFEAGTANVLVPSTSTVNAIPYNDHDHFQVGDIDVNDPLQSASKFVDASLLRDKTTPVLDDSLFHGKAVEYNFGTDPEKLGAYHPFDRTEIISIPDDILEQYNKVETHSDMGIFADILRAWIIIDNKLILWNLSKISEFQTFDDIKQTIRKVELVKPKPGVFANSINYLLILATSSDIHILAISYTNNELEIYNAGMTVPTHGLNVNAFIAYEKTGQIFFTGSSDGLNIWELQYSNSEDWFNKKCNKRCLTRSTVSNVIPGSSVLNSIVGYFSENDPNEKIMQLQVDNSRGILYTLSDKSIIRAYKITSGSIDDPKIVRPVDISTYARTSSAKASQLLSAKYLKIVSLNVVTRFENEDLFLVAITVGGCRLYLNGSFSSYSVSALRLESVKFPPAKITPDEIQQEQHKYKEQEALKTTANSIFSATRVNRDELPTMLTYQKKSGVLLESKPSSKVLSPGIFFDVVEKEGSKDHKLFVSVPDYGVLKYHEKYAENATFLESFGKIHQIVPLSPTFNATDRPQGYANEFATQYSKGPFEVAVLTNASLQIYRFRTPDLIFEDLVENFSTFVTNYGYLESAATALYVTCKYNIPKVIRTNAFSFFTLGIPNLVEFKPRYNQAKPTSLVSLALSTNKSADPTLSFQNVIFSPRFYGTVTLVGRLFRDIWDDKVFNITEGIKYTKAGTLIKESIFENEFLESINIDQTKIEFYLSSISVLNEFFQTYGNSIACFVPNNFQTNTDKFEEFANQSENIAINSIIRLIISIKEALSFLIVLIKETDPNSKLRDIFKNISLEIQILLSKLKFKDLFAPNEASKNLIKEILSSIINRSMSKGESIEYIAKGLQERCGTFCSTDDVIGFRAIEHLRKAKELGFKDPEGINYHLNRAIELFQAINNNITLEKLKESIEIMISLNEFPKAIKFALNISSGIDPGNLAAQYVADGKLNNDERCKYYIKRHEIFEIIFQLLIEVDKLALENSIIKDESQINYIKIRNDSYEIALKFEDSLFQFELYEWFISQDASEKLLEIDTNYILQFLEQKSQQSLIISDLLWIYQSKKNNYYEAALISYNLALSDFKISLTQRNEYLSRAIGFCNCITLPSQRQQVVELFKLIEEVFEASNVQYDLLIEITNDEKIPEAQKVELVESLNDKILTVSELFNDFASVLKYHEIILQIFKISDFRNSEEILSRYLEFFEEYKHEKNLLISKLIKIGKKLSNSEFVLPTKELIPILLNVFQDEGYPIIKGEIIKIFIEIGISFDKLYHVLKDLIDLKDFNNEFYQDELKEFVKIWYKEDLKIREILQIEDFNNINLDKVHELIIKTGDVL